ncbi:MAG: Hsp20/alpha crystallin family protein [Paracoccaceae bacterium]
MADTKTKLDVKKDAAAPAPAQADSWTPFGSLRHEIERLFDDFDPMSWREPLSRRILGREGQVELSPAMDLMEHKDAYEISAELPGMDEKDVDIKISNGALLIKGEKTEETEKEEQNYYLSERRYGAFQRRFRLPEGVDADKIEATYSKGVLRVTLPKSKDVMEKEKHVPIKAA